MRRLDELRDADNLAILCLVHPESRCHPLKGNRKGQWVLELEFPHGLLFEIDNDPLPKLGDGSLDKERVTMVRVIGVENYHG